jgi:hypothetical protein
VHIGVWQDETPKGGVDAALTRIREVLSAAKADCVDLSE